MNRILILLAVAAVLPLAVACGGGGDDPKTAPTSTPVAERETPEAEAPDDVEATPDIDSEGSAGGTAALDSILPTVFEQAFSGEPGEALRAGLEPGDPALLAYLLDASELPEGYTSMGEFSFRAPDGISETGAGDIAMMMASRGDPNDPDPTKSGALMTMVMRFDDLQDLEDAFAGVSPEDFEDSLLSGATDMEGVEFVDVQALDTDGLGENALGVSFTIDMSAFFDALVDSFSVDGELPEEAGDLDQFTSISMRMYIFGEGDLAGGIIRVGFGDSLADGVDELALAQALKAKLAAAE